ELALAPDQRRRGCDGCFAAALDRVERHRLHGVREPLEPQRLDRLRPETRRRSIEQLDGHEDLTWARLGHQARRERRRAAEDRVGATERRADLAREYPAAADAGRERQLRLRVD